MKLNERGYKVIESADLIDYRVFNDNLRLLMTELANSDESFTSIVLDIEKINDNLTNADKKITENEKLIKINQQSITETKNDLQSHLDDKANPHEVTLEMLNGASTGDIKNLQTQIDTINEYFGGILEREF